MSLVIDSIKDVMWELLSDRMAIPLMFADQKIQIPLAGVYGTIKIITLPIQTGQDSIEVQGENLIVSGQRDLTMSLNLYRKGSIQKIVDLQIYMQTELFKAKLRTLAAAKPVPLALVNAGTIQDLTSLVQSDYEERVNLDIRLRSVSSITDDETGIIESTEITSNYNRGEGDPSPLTNTFTIP